MTFPIRHKTHILEQRSETFLRSQLPQGWTINRPDNDYGVDFQIGIAENGELRGLELIVQLKASKNSSGPRNTETVQLKVSTYNYLRKLLTVVMLVKYVESENEAYWTFLRDFAPPNKENRETFTIHIPKTNKLSRIDWQVTTGRIRHITDLKLGAVNG
jgi:hypothetical protein